MMAFFTGVLQGTDARWPKAFAVLFLLYEAVRIVWIGSTLWTMMAAQHRTFNVFFGIG